jgi:hypothetical protein
MDKEYYGFEYTEHRYEFESVGINGIIKKVVTFQSQSGSQYFVHNLALGDYDEKTDITDYKNVSNNGDMPKVLATIFRIIFDFLTLHPNHVVNFMGNHPTKQKLYQRLIRNNIDDLLDIFEVFGLDDNNILEPFDKTKDYKSFSVIFKRNFPTK